MKQFNNEPDKPYCTCAESSHHVPKGIETMKCDYCNKPPKSVYTEYYEGYRTVGLYEEGKKMPRIQYKVLLGDENITKKADLFDELKELLNKFK